MAKPWEITRDDLDEWVSRVPIEATAVLPRLIRRLLFATSPLRDITMRAGGGVRYEGWDGIVRAQTGTMFCPPMLSVWEISVEKNVRKKLDEDYDKRSAHPPEGVRPSFTSYVAVTARAFPKKAEWIEQKKAVGAWRDVRAYDADDLAMWIEQAPAVARWFANLQGRPAYEGKDIEAYLDGWRKRTLPPLPIELVLAGESRLAQSDELLGWANALSEGDLTVRGRTREEALVFAAASLAREPGRDERLSRAMVVESEDAWRWALGVQRASSLILLPAFDKPDLGQAAAAKVRVILPADTTVPRKPAGMLTLDAQPYAPMAKALETEGFAPVEARELIERAGGDLAALQRLCGYVEIDLPAWAKNNPRPELFALLLAGAWVPTSAGDREVIRRLGGDPAEAERISADFAAQNVMAREASYFGSDVLRWNALEDRWNLLGPGLTDGLLDRFREVVMEVLGAKDPAYELSKEERYLAAVKGKARTESDALREGLAVSIARLSLHDDVLAASRGGVRAGARMAEGLVGWLLRREHGWVIWASLSRLLPVLAETCPEVFLTRVAESLDQGEGGVAHLFAEDQGPFGTAPHVGLLWALELLGWYPKESVRRQVVLALTRLDASYPQGGVGRVDNRPLQSLDTLLRYALPASRTTAEERNELLKVVFRQNAETGRKLALKLVQDLRGLVLLHQGVRPRFHEWAPKQPPSEIVMSEVDAQIACALDLLVEDAGSDGARWAAIADAALHSPEETEEHILNLLVSHRGRIQDPDGKLWAWLRGAISNVPEAHTEHPRYRILNELYAYFTPKDLVSKYAWLFEPFPHLPGTSIDDVEEHVKKVDAERNNALVDLWDGHPTERWDLLRELVIAVRVFNRGVIFLGEALAKSSYTNELDARILADVPEPPLSDLAVGYGSVRARILGLPWLTALLDRFVNAGRLDEAARIADGAVDWKTIRYRELWNVLHEPLLSAYFRVVPRIIGQPPEEDMKYAIERLAEVGRTDVGLQSAAINRSSLTGTAAFLALNKYRSKPPINIDPSAPHYIEQLFAKIDADPPQGKDPLKDLAPLELFYLPALSQQARPARYVSQAFAEDPGIFVGLMVQLYRREGDPKPAEPDADSARIAQNAYTLLHAWKGYPGEGLPEDQRDAKLQAWAVQVLDQCKENGRDRAATVHVAEILARVPRAGDGDWPCFAARHLLEAGLYPDLGDALSLAQRNRRGPTRRALDEGGAQERQRAEIYREGSRRMEATYPRTAAMLDSLAHGYESEAERHEAEAQRVRILHGEQPEEEAPPSTPRDQTAPPTGAPLSRLITTGVGPALVFDVPFRPRLNLLIGDNSLGKTFILEVLWWVLTGRWAGEPARPVLRRANGRAASLSAEAGKRQFVAEYDFANERWKKRPRPLAPGLTLYARADGGFSIWDPIRNAKPIDKTELDLSGGYNFTSRSLFYGLSAKDGVTKLCRGLIEDVVSWRSERRRAYAALEKVLAQLSMPEEPIKLGLPKRFKVRDPVTHPTLDLGYESSVFVVHASAAVKRILGLAYLLVWAVSEIEQAAPLVGKAPLEQVTLLIDEIDAHLYPRWQRVILPALLDVMDALGTSAKVQLIVTTHAPLVLASVEQRFDKSQDELIEIQRSLGKAGRVVRVVEEPWQRLGDANTWLIEHFGLKEPRSRESEEAITAAEAALEKPKLGKKEWMALNKRLHEVLSDMDPFWVGWQYYADKRGWLS